MMTSPCAFPLLCWLGKGEDLHDLVTLFILVSVKRRLRLGSVVPLAVPDASRSLNSIKSRRKYSRPK